MLGGDHSGKIREKNTRHTGEASATAAIVAGRRRAAWNTMTGFMLVGHALDWVFLCLAKNGAVGD